VGASGGPPCKPFVRRTARPRERLCSATVVASAGRVVRLVHRDPTTGRLRLRLETPSDLWRIAQLAHAGDALGASTTRRDPEAPEDTQAAHRERRRVWLVVRVESVEFHGFSRHVRVSGPIVEGPFDLGRHHTLDLAEGDEVTLAKPEFTASDRAILDEGVHAKDEPTLVLAAVDYGESSVVRLRGRAIEPVAEVSRTIAGKRYGGPQGERDRADYVRELVDLLRREAPRATALVIAGPGFLKEELVRSLTDGHPGLRSKIRVFPTAESGGSGIHELLRSGRASEALRGSVAAEEEALVERWIASLGGGKRAAVGPNEVGEALDAGAAETVVVHESLLREPNAIRLLERAREGRARVFVVRDEGEAGRRLAALGRIGALLRFDFVPPSALARRRAPAG
jgi:protein pelota